MDGVFGDSEHDFWDEAFQKPTREAIFILDNAPYHHGIGVQFNNDNNN